MKFKINDISFCKISIIVRLVFKITNIDDITNLISKIMQRNRHAAWENFSDFSINVPRVIVV